MCRIVETDLKTKNLNLKSFIEHLETQLQKPLPGKEAHKLMSPIRNENWIDIDKKPYPKKLKMASVICLFIKKQNGIHFILMKRTESPYTHSAQISFPGGGIEIRETEKQAALRELQEEIGIELLEENIIGKLTNIYIPVSNFKVHPFVAFFEGKVKYKLDKLEVDYVFEVPLSDLLNDNKIKKMQMETKYGKMPIKYFDFENEIVWGATAVILSELKMIIQNFGISEIRDVVN